MKEVAHEGANRFGAACRGQASYRLPLAPVRAGSPSRRHSRQHVMVSSIGRASHPPFFVQRAPQAVGTAVNALPCFHTAQAIRASLLASATAALL